MPASWTPAVKSFGHGTGQWTLLACPASIPPTTRRAGDAACRDVPQHQLWRPVPVRRLMPSLIPQGAQATDTDAIRAQDRQGSCRVDSRRRRKTPAPHNKCVAEDLEIHGCFGQEGHECLMPQATACASLPSFSRQYQEALLQSREAGQEFLQYRAKACYLLLHSGSAADSPRRGNYPQGG